MSLPLVDVPKVDRYSVTGWDFEGMAGGCMLPFVQPWLSVSIYYVRIEVSHRGLAVITLPTIKLACTTVECVNP